MLRPLALVAVLTASIGYAPPALAAASTPSWIGPVPTGGAAGYELEPVSTPSGSLRAAQVGTSITYQRYTASGWSTPATVTGGTDAHTDRAVVTADDTTVRFVQPFLDAAQSEHLRFVQTGTSSTDLGIADTPALATDSTGASMIVMDSGENDEDLVATPVLSNGTVGTPVVLTSGFIYESKVVATGAGTFLAVWSTTNGAGTTAQYATYAAGTWSAPAAVPGITNGLVTDLVSTSTRAVLAATEFSGGPEYLTFTAGTWATTSARSTTGDLTVGPDGTVYAGGSTVGVLAPASSTWTSGVALPGSPTGASCDDLSDPSASLVWDNAVGGLRTFQDVQSSSGCESVTWAIGSRTAGTSLFTSVTPRRVLDTRSGLGAARAAVGPGKSITLSFAGLIPADATAVALNVAGTGGTADTYITGYPAGTAKPTASSLNLAKGQTAASLGIFKLGTGQGLTLTNYAGSLQLIGDLAGYESPSGLPYTPVTPLRVLKTTTALGPGASLTLDLTGIVPADATAVAMNVSGFQTTASTYLSAFPAGSSRPSASTVNIAAHETTTNLAILKLGNHQALTIFNFSGQTQVVGDLAGYYSGVGNGYVALAPTRVLDTRTGLGAPRGARTPGSTFTLSFSGKVPADATAVAVMLTGVTPNVPAYLSAFPAGSARPSASTVNTTPGRATGNLAIVKLGTVQGLSIYDGLGTQHVVGDLVGYFR